MADVDKASSFHVESTTKPYDDRVSESFEGLSAEETQALEKKCLIAPLTFLLMLESGQANARTVVRKIDLHLISSLFLLFIFNILDRSNIANARLGGMQEDLHLSDTQYQTAVAIMVSRTRMCQPCMSICS